MVRGTVRGTLNNSNFQIFKFSNICIFKLSNFHISKLPYFQTGLNIWDYSRISILSIFQKSLHIYTIACLEKPQSGTLNKSNFQTFPSGTQVVLLQCYVDILYIV